MLRADAARPRRRKWTRLLGWSAVPLTVLVGGMVAGAALAPGSRVPISVTSAAAVSGGFPVVSGSNAVFIEEPEAGSAPFVDAIDSAKTSIDVDMYLITDHGVEKALVAAAKRGVDVRVVLEREPYGLVPDAERAATLLRAAGVHVHFAPPRFVFDHAKMMVVDSSVAFIGSANFTYYGLHHNREDDVKTTNPAVVQAATEVFDADYHDHRAGRAPRETLVLSPGSAKPLVSLIDSATSRLEIEQEEAPDAQIRRALEQAAARGVPVELLEASTASNRSGAGAYELARLVKAGVQVAIVEHPYLHTKLIVANDDVFFGSENFSYTSTEQNREIGVILSDPPFLSSVLSQISTDESHAVPVSPTLPSPKSTTLGEIVTAPGSFDGQLVRVRATLEARFGPTAFVEAEVSSGRGPSQPIAPAPIGPGIPPGQPVPPVPGPGPVPPGVARVGGVELYLGSVRFAKLRPGDELSMVGYVDHYQGQLEIDAVRRPVVLGMADVQAPYQAPLGALDRYDGLLVETTGSVDVHADGRVFLHQGPATVRLSSLGGTTDLGTIRSGEIWRGVGVAYVSHGHVVLAATLAESTSQAVPVVPPGVVGTVTIAQFRSDLANLSGSYVRIAPDPVVAAVFDHGEEIYVTWLGLGLRCYLGSELAHEFRPGQVLAISGKATLYDGTPEIDPVEEPMVVATGAAPRPVALRVSQIGQSSLDDYVQVVGTVRSVGTDTFVIQGAHGATLSVYRATQGLAAVSVGERVLVTGVVGLYHGSLQLEATAVQAAPTVPSPPPGPPGPRP